MTLIRVFVNNQVVEVEEGATAGEAASAADPAFGAPGRLAITDARGIEIPATTVLGPGSILRVHPRRQDADADA